MIIGVTGRKRSGKDTFADYVINKYKNKIVKYSFAKPLKEACRQMFCFNDEQLYGEEKEDYDSNWNTTCRKILQKFGTEIMRDYVPKLFPNLKIEKSFWIDRFKIWFNDWILNNPNGLLVIADVRFID